MSASLSSRILRAAGLLLQVCAFAFLAYVLRVNFDRLRATHVVGYGLLALLVALTAASVLMILMLVLGWRELLRGAGAPGVSVKSVFWVIGRTAIAKYVPGNVFQYVGRQMFGGVLGADQQTIFAATLGEILIVASFSCLIALLCVPFASLPAMPLLPRIGALSVLAAGACAPLIFWIAAPRLSARRPFQLLKPLLQIGPACWARSFASYGICLLIGTGIFLAAAAYFVGPLQANDLATLAAAYSVSYAFGFMLPGAPGGLGVREALIVLLATAHVDQSSIVTAAIVQRLSSILAEALCFGVSFCMSVPRRAVS
jgi:hypothetical protein